MKNIFFHNYKICCVCSFKRGGGGATQKGKSLSDESLPAKFSPTVLPLNCKPLHPGFGWEGWGELRGCGRGWGGRGCGRGCGHLAVPGGPAHWQRPPRRPNPPRRDPPKGSSLLCACGTGVSFALRSFLGRLAAACLFKLPDNPRVGQNSGLSVQVLSISPRPFGFIRYLLLFLQKWI